MQKKLKLLDGAEVKCLILENSDANTPVQGSRLGRSNLSFFKSLVLEMKATASFIKNPKSSTKSSIEANFLDQRKEPIKYTHTQSIITSANLKKTNSKLSVCMPPNYNLSALLSTCESNTSVHTKIF